MNHELLYHFFDDDDFLRISNKIQETEKITSGEIRISIKEKMNYFQKRKGLRKLAEEEFFNLNMHETRDKTGILLYLVLEERQFWILADSGINEKVPGDTWENVRDEMQKKFKGGFYTEGILLGIERVGEILSEHFPIKPDDTNELSNKVVV